MYCETAGVSFSERHIEARAPICWGACLGGPALFRLIVGSVYETNYLAMRSVIAKGCEAISPAAYVEAGGAASSSTHLDTEGIIGGGVVRDHEQAATPGHPSGERIRGADPWLSAAADPC